MGPSVPVCLSSSTQAAHSSLSHWQLRWPRGHTEQAPGTGEYPLAQLVILGPQLPVSGPIQIASFHRRKMFLIS